MWRDDFATARERHEIRQAMREANLRALPEHAQEQDLAPILTESAFRQLIADHIDLRNRIVWLEHALAAAAEITVEELRQRGRLALGLSLQGVHVRHGFSGTRDQVAEGIRALGEDPEP